MILDITDSNSLTTPVKTLERTKYFPFEVQAVNLMAGTNYDVYYNGTLVNAFCKPYGGNLGDQLVSDPYGKLTFMYMLAVPYNQTYLVNNAPNVSGDMSQVSMLLELVAPNGARTKTYIPINLKM